jgi:hypothetical protein
VNIVNIIFSAQSLTQRTGLKSIQLITTEMKILGNVLVTLPQVPAKFSGNL